MCPCASNEKYELPVMVGWNLNTFIIVIMHTLAAEENGRPCIPPVIGCRIRGAQLRMRTGAQAHAFHDAFK